MDKNQIAKFLITAAGEAETMHRKAQLAERYGQAAYHQGLRDGLRRAAELVLTTAVTEEASPAPESVGPTAEA